MRTATITGLLLLLACFGVASAEPIDLRILYAGKSGSDRETDFVDCLAAHFAHVDTGDLATFEPSGADGYDVVILDWDGDGFKAPMPSLPRTYDRPTILVGVMGAFLSGNMQLKTGYI